MRRHEVFGVLKVTVSLSLKKRVDYTGNHTVGCCGFVVVVVVLGVVVFGWLVVWFGLFFGFVGFFNILELIQSERKKTCWCWLSRYAKKYLFMERRL